LQQVVCLPVNTSREIWKVTHLKTKFGKRAFSFAGPVTWNSLPAELRSISDSTIFKNKLKTYLFNMAFNVQ